MKKILRMIVVVGLASVLLSHLLGVHGILFALSETIDTQKETIKIFEDDTCVIYGKGEKRDAEIHWKINYERKEILEEKTLSFLLMKEDIILGEDYISEEIRENFHYIKPFWQTKEASLKMNEFISFRTPDEAGWAIKIFDGDKEEPIPNFQEFKTILLSENYVVNDNSTEDSIIEDESPAEGSNESNKESNVEDKDEDKENSSEEELPLTEDENEQEEVDAVTGATTGKGELAPKNAILINDIFGGMHSEPANPNPFYSEISKKNYYTGLQTFPEFGPNDPRKNRVYYLAGNSNRMSVFSRPEYRLNFSNSFQGMVYISLGVNRADGMTFTLHRDSRGSGVQGALNDSDKGGALGVYPFKMDDWWSSFDTKGAIGNSLTVEFDMIFNNDGLDQFIDNGKYPHVALTYPGIKSGYKGVGLAPKSYQVIHHQTKNTTDFLKSGYQNKEIDRTDPDEPVEINWNELEFSYDATKKILTFDLYLPSKKGRAKIWTAEVGYEELKTSLKLFENDNDNLVYWGFTAANGKATGMDGFAVAKIPLNFSVENKVYKNNDTDITLDSSQGNMEEKHATEEEQIRLAGRVSSGDGQGNVTEGILELDYLDLKWDEEVLPLEKITQLKIQKLDSLTNTVINEISYTPEELTEDIWQDDEDGSGKKIPLPNPFDTLNENEHLWAVLTFENGVLEEGNVDRDGFQVSQFQMQAKTKNGVIQSGPPAYFALKMFGEAELLIVPNFLFGNEDGKTSLSYLHENKSIPLNIVRPTAGIERNRDYYFPIDFYLLDRRSLSDKEANPLTINTKFDFYTNDEGLNTYTPEMKLKYRKKEDSISEQSIIDDNQNIIINQENTQIAIVEANTKRIQLDFHTYLEEGLLDFSRTMLPNNVGLYQATITWSLENVPKP